MTDSDILKLIDNPGLINRSDINQLRMIVSDYPFFQTAHILLLKALKTKNQSDFDQQLSRSSVYVGNRDLLYKFLKKEITVADDEIKDLKKHEAKVEQENSILLKNKSVRRKIVDSFDGMGENISETISSQLDFSIIKDSDSLEYPSEIYFIDEEREGKNNIITIDADPEKSQKTERKKDILQIDEVSKTKKEVYLEKAQVNEDHFELIEIEEIEKQEPKENKNKADIFDINDYIDETVMKEDSSLIANFIKKNPRIKPKELDDEIVDVSEESAKEDSNLLTETLVKVYINQGLFEKAILAYKKLSLKYPEKSTYFASQIEIIQEKINKQ